MRGLFPWVPLAAIAVHLFEEFVWPGGFVQWYRHYPPGRVVAVSMRFIIVINALFVALATAVPLSTSSPRGWALWLIVMAVAAVNGAFHVVATVQTRAYTPGVVSGVCLYIPLAVSGGLYLLQLELVSVGTAIEAVLIAAVYQVWSIKKHQRATMRYGAA